MASFTPPVTAVTGPPSTPAPETTKEEEGDDPFAALDALEKEALEFKRDSEIDRILKAFQLDAYAILNILPGAPDSQIKIQYRTLSLLIHPDKSSNPSAPTAFDRLKKAQITLLDAPQRLHLDESIADARTLLLRERKLTTDSPEARLLNEEGEMKEAWRRKTVEVLVEAEARRRKQMRAKLQEEGREMRKVEEEIEGRKRRREHEAEWEASREGRIGSWRDWKGGAGKAGGELKGKEASDGKEAPTKKKKKLKVLG